METPRWERLEALFLAALERDAPERAAFVAGACQGDPLLHAEVAAMLAAHDPEQALHLEARLLEAGDAPPHPRAGAYRLTDEIGRGGMGSVYLAERADGQFAQRVALKLVKRGMDTDAILGRFRQERQILAALAHPGIARLYDGGVADDGRPFFAMEYVEGLPITAYCDQHRLDVQARLRLFLQVAEAVHYAHQNLVVHRDLKPSNILVTKEGQAKLLDFGIAKLLDPAQATIATQGEVRLLTPAYAAPEQLMGAPVTTATDVYGLGVLLYELLTGGRPYALDGLAREAVVRVICETPPERPSAAVRRQPPPGAAQPEALARHLRGDLDTVVLKAMAKEPAHRYASAEAFAADVARFLGGHPVEARPAGAFYRLRKFARRHAVPVAAACVAAALLLAFALTVSLQNRSIAAARDRAEQELSKAQAVTDFMIGLFEASNPNEEQDKLSAAALLDRGAARAEELAAQPAVQAQMMAAVGRAYWSLGRYEQAEPLLAQALALRRSLYGATHADVAESLGHLAMLRADHQGDYDGAAALYLEMLGIYRRLYGPDHERLATVLSSLAALHFYKNELDAAAGRFREALAMMRRLPPDAQQGLAGILNNLALTLIRQGDAAGAEPYLRESLALNRTLHGDAHPDVATNLNILAEALYAQQKYDEAEPLYADVLARRRRLYGDVHPAVAAVLNNLAQLHRQRGALDQAEGYAREAVAIQRSAQGPEHPLLALGLKNLGNLLQLQGRHAEAEATLLESLAIFRAQFGDEHAQVANVRARLVELYTAWGKPAQAARYAPPDDPAATR